MKRDPVSFHMPRRKDVQFANGEIYHIITRAIESIKLFRDKQDYSQMIRDLFRFNDLSPVISTQRVICHRSKNETRPGLVSFEERRERKLLVEILAFCLMPNHIHLLVKQLQDNGIQKFMQKFTGYAIYFNKKYQRQGYLFRGRFRAVHIQDDKQLMTVFIYIHTNPVAIIYPKWKENRIENVKKAMQFIEEYKWSSYPDYLGNKNFPSITNREFLTELMDGQKGCREFVEDWLYQKRELSGLEELAIE